jgi:hypothetical protein
MARTKVEAKNSVRGRLAEKALALETTRPRIAESEKYNPKRIRPTRSKSYTSFAMPPNVLELSCTRKR